MTDRHSSIQEPNIITDPNELAFAEARNALRQFDMGMLLLDHWLEREGKSINLKISDLLTLNRFALEDINKSAGTFRTQPIEISNSKHQPPEAKLVPSLCEDFCDYINKNWSSASALHLSAYALWRINWIHPFVDGNGRTARIISYVILCAKYGFRLPGIVTIPEQIAKDKNPYYSALESADHAFFGGQIDVKKMEQIIERSLAEQLETAVNAEPKTINAKAKLQILDEKDLFIPRRQTVEKILLTVNISSHSNDIDKRNFIERNPTLFNVLGMLIAAGIGSLVTWILAV
jgi:Fic family protein